MSELVSFGLWLEKRRKHLGLTRRALAALVGCAPVTIQKIERDERRPSVQIARLLAQHLQLPADSHDIFIRRARGEFVTSFPAFRQPSDHIDRIQGGQPTTKWHNLPLEVTPFVGRAAELAQLGELLNQPGCRLISIVGTGGMGKTRLALAAAQHFLPGADRFADGLFFVSLGPLQDPGQVPLAILEALEFPLDNSNQHQRTVAQQLLDYLREKQMLLILDNLEHLLATVDFIGELLGTAPGVQLLVTTRERLKLREEHLLPLAGLDFPDLGVNLAEAGTYTAVELFLQAATRVFPDFTIQLADLRHLIRICQLVEGMPLGLELAAGWVDTLPLAAIANEMQQSSDFLATDLHNVPERHRSMQAVVAYSWGRLSETEQILFAQLAIFRGGFTLPAARAITGASVRSLQILVEKSLIQFSQTEGRYQIHELLRQFGAEQLTQMAASVNQVEARYCQYYCQLAASQLADLVGANQAQALEIVGQEFGNITQAWSQALSHGEDALLVPVADVIGHHHELRGQYEAGLAHFATTAATLAAENGVSRWRLRLKAIIWQAVFLQIHGEFQQADHLLRRGLAEYTDQRAWQAEGRGEKAALLLRLGIGQSQATVTTEACDNLEQSQALFAAMGDQWGQARALEELGRSRTFFFAESAAADQILAQSLALYRELGNQRSIAHTLGWLALSASYQGKFALSAELARESLQIGRRLPGRADLAYGLESYGMMLSHLGRFEEAVELLAEALALYLELGNRLQGMFTRSNFGHVLLYAGQVQQAREQFKFYDHGFPSHRAWQFARLAELASYEQDHEAAYYYACQSEKIWSQSCVSRAESVAVLVHVALGRAQYDLGVTTEAKQNLATALEIVLDRRNFLTLARSVMPNVALVLADDGQPELALKIDAMLSMTYPAYCQAEYYVKGMRNQILAHGEAATPGLGAAAGLPGNHADPWQLAKESLAYFKT